MFYNLKSLLPKSIKRAGIEGQIKDKQVIEFFDEIKKEFLGPESASRVRPMYFKNEILYVASLSSVAAEKLEAREAEVRNRINKEFGSGTVKKLKFIT
jgi:predicted nucleic acid-binding Zn ribbon protein